jgi:hypothetical protein
MHGLIYRKDFMVLLEGALENFRQMSARNYDERRPTQFMVGRE